MLCKQQAELQTEDNENDCSRAGDDPPDAGKMGRTGDVRCSGGLLLVPRHCRSRNRPEPEIDNPSGRQSRRTVGLLAESPRASRRRRMAALRL